MRMKILQKWAATVAIPVALAGCDETIVDANIACEGL